MVYGIVSWGGWNTLGISQEGRHDVWIWLMNGVPLCAEYRWVLSDALLRKASVLGQGSLRRDVGVYAVYFLHPRADVIGLEGLHGLLLSSYVERVKQCRQWCHYPLFMLWVFAVMRAVTQAVLEESAGSFGWIGLCVLFTLFLRVSLWDYLNREACRGYLFPSQICFESWVLLLSWQRRHHPWHEVKGGEHPWAARLSYCWDEVRAHAMRENHDVTEEIEGLCIRRLEESKAIFYRSTNIFWGMWAVVLYACLAWMAVMWASDMLKPLSELEREWTVSAW